MPSTATSDLTVASVHRAMNERRRTLEPPAEDATVRCECECHRVECFNSFRIGVEDYEDVRAEAHHFVVTPGHQSPGESVIAMTHSYLVIEKARGRAQTELQV